MGHTRLRDLGICIGRLETSRFNAITDVPGVTVGFSTIVHDEPSIARTGVTAIWPSDDIYENFLFSGCHSFNGNGEMTGMAWIAEQGLLTSPICITNTHSVGVVRDAIVRDAVERGSEKAWQLPVAAETWDGWLSEAETFPVAAQHALDALASAATGPVAEGNVGGGTGMVAHEFKGGTGTSSRIVDDGSDSWTVAALVQANYGSRHLFRVDGVPVGEEINADVVPVPREEHAEQGSIIIVLATDAPMLPIQCQRLARRATVGLSRVGGIGGNGSGDIFIAFSTANKVPVDCDRAKVDMVGPEPCTALFEAAAEATEEAILNAMIAAETMTGRAGRTVHALPHDRLVEVMRKYGRLTA